MKLSCGMFGFDVVMVCCMLFFFKQKTAYEMRISDWSSDVCSSDLVRRQALGPQQLAAAIDDQVAVGELVRRDLFAVEEAVVLEIGGALCRESVCQYV